MNGLFYLNAWYSVLKDLVFALISFDWFEIDHFNRWLINYNYSIIVSVVCSLSALTFSSLLYSKKYSEWKMEIIKDIETLIFLLWCDSPVIRPGDILFTAGYLAFQFRFSDFSCIEYCGFERWVRFPVSE